VSLIAILVVAAAASPASAASDPLRADFRSCGDIARMYTHDIKVQGVQCRKAKRVVIRYARETIENLQHDWSLTILGFKCDLTRKDYYGDSHRCTAGGGRVITWRRGTHN
jgi:hypothetical protein